ncbi:MAG: amidohydrolase family protein, partial [Lutispora sp.]|jgi:5-methylthioadenosine/S-adenosylhomocysteine deaminase
MSPIKLADKAGLLNERTIAAHCVVVDDEDMEILKEKKVNVVHNPGSNMKLASGIAPIKAMADMGINIALGTDGASSNNNLDMLEEMRTATYLQKVITKDPTALPVDQVLRMATINGARALGFDNVGEVKKGMAADLIVINTDKPWYYPKYNVKSAIVYSGNSSDVEFVIIDGNIVMEKGQVLTMDEERILYEVQKRAF